MEKADPSSPLRRDAGHLTAKEVFDAARKGDPLGTSVVSESIRHLAAGIINAVVLFDPEVVILGGGLMGSADLMLPKIREAVDRLSPTRPEIRRAQLGDDAGVIGGAALVLKECERPHRRRHLTWYTAQRRVSPMRMFKGWILGLILALTGSLLSGCLAGGETSGSDHGLEEKVIVYSPPRKGHPPGV